jgi:hypothetical protein
MAVSRGSGGGKGKPSGEKLVLQEIARTAKDTKDLISRLVSIARFGATAGGGGVPGVSAGRAAGGTPAGVSGSGPKGGTPSDPFAERQQSHYERATAYSQIGLGNYGGRLAQWASRAEGLKALGFNRGAAMLSRAAPGLSLGGAVLNLVKSGIDKAAATAEILGDPFATGSMKNRALFRELMPGGETLQKWYDAFSGRKAGMEKAQQQGRHWQIEAQGRLTESGFYMGFNPQQAGREATARHYGANAAVLPGIFDRSTVGGRTAYEDAQRLLPYRKESLRMEREHAAATATRVAAEKELTRLERTQNALIAEREDLNPLLKKGSGVLYQQRLERHKNLTQEIEGINQQVREAKQATVSARQGEAVAGAASTAAKAREAHLGAAENLRARAERSESTAARLGSMDPFQRALGAQALDMLKSGANPDLMPAQYKAAAQAYAPDEFQAIVTNHGARTREFKAGEAKGLRGFEGNYGDLYRKADEEEAAGGRAEYDAESQAAGAIAIASRDLGAYIARAMVTYVQNAKDAFDTTLREARNLR